MLNLFNKSKVRSGKQTNEEKKPVAAAAQAGQNKKPAPFAALGKTWAKLNKMDRKQAYTFGAIAVVVLVALVMFATAASSSGDDAFADLQTRGYDLANMPFSSDEAEQYLLASKYPDMQNATKNALYSKKDKEARQAEDAAKAAAELDTSASSTASEYVPGRYYGGTGGGRNVSPTKVNSLNSASLKSGSGSGMSGTFGPSGDFSNFKSQEKGGDKFTPQGPGSGDARRALFQTATGSRAAAGLKDDKLLNAKKALMGGNVKGSGAFLSDSGAVDLSKAGGLNLDTNAPVSSVDTGAFDDALQDANQEAAEEAIEEDENRWWQEKLMEFAQMVAQNLISWGLNSAENAVNTARQQRTAEQLAMQETISENQEYFKNQPQYSKGDVTATDIGNDVNLQKELKLTSKSDGLYNSKGEMVVRRTQVQDPDTGKTLDSFSYEGKYEQKQLALNKKQAARVNKQNFNDVAAANPKVFNSYELNVNRKIAQIKGTPFYSPQEHTPTHLDADGREYVIVDGQRRYLQPDAQ